MGFKGMTAAVCVAAAVLSGCVSTQPSVSHDAAAKAGAGYIATAFPHSAGVGFVLFLVNLDTGADVAMAPGDFSLLKDATVTVTAIDVPPGHYAVADWGTIDTLTRQSHGRQLIIDPRVTAPFEVVAGHVAYLGRYDAQVSTTGNGLTGLTEHSRLRPMPGTVADSRQAFAAAYPALAPLAFDCALCSDVAPAVRVRPAVAYPPAPAPARAGQPEGAVALTDDLFDQRLWRLAGRDIMMYPHGALDTSVRGSSRHGTYRVENDKLCIDGATGDACKMVVFRDGALSLLSLGKGTTEVLGIR